ncbi:MAG: IS630 family transposase [Chloroflexota bacterium]|nr:IS630 family transposase [Chloroflexota bacterium]
MNISIHFTRPTIKSLTRRLEQAYAAGDLRSVRRISALLGLAKGETVTEVAETISMSRQTIYNWLKAFMLRGIDSLVYHWSRGRKPRLTQTQKKRLSELVKAGPLEAGYATGCWTSLLIQHLILREFGVLYNRHYVCQLLRNLGFSFQKAKFVSDHLDEEARRKWRQEVWPEILRQAREKDAMILLQDEVSFAQWGSLGYTWAPVGQQPVIKTTGKRKGYKVFGAVAFFSGCFFYQGLKERFNSERYQDFLRQIFSQTSKHLILIQDGAKYHTSKAPRAFFEVQKDRLTVFQLPSYSPDYNPIEFLWKKMKQRATHNRYFPAFEALASSVESALAYFASQVEEIKNLMGLYVESPVAVLPAVA